MVSAENDLHMVFNRYLIESEEEELEDAEDNLRSIVLPVSSCDDDSDFESGSESEEMDNGETIEEWSNNVLPHDPWIFDENQSCVNQRLLQGCQEPIHFYELFMKGIWDLIVNETNRYGQEKDESWEPTTVKEMKRFIGLCFQMGIVRLPRLKDYWSSSSAFGCNPIGSQSMARTRFEKLLAHLHFANNANCNGEDRLYKISPLIELVNKACERIYKPGKDIYIDKSIVPLRCGVTFCPRIPDKRHKFGIRLYKLCSRDGYTYKTVVHAGKETSINCSTDELAMKKLMENLLDQGRHVYSGDWCTNLLLAENLLQRKTHLIGTCRKDKKGLPKQVIQQKLRRGQLKAQQNRNGIMVLKWKDKKEVLMISTTHDASISADSIPQVVVSYNGMKLFVDTNYQTACYSPFIRKASKWYIRIFFHLIVETCLVNAWKIYCETVQNVAIDEFKIQVYLSLLKIDGAENGTPLSQHILEDTGPVAKTRRRCIGCYKKLAEFHDSRTAGKRAKQITTRCTQCGKHFCLDCFNNSHKKQV